MNCSLARGGFQTVFLKFTEKISGNPHASIRCRHESRRTSWRLSTSTEEEDAMRLQNTIAAIAAIGITAALTVSAADARIRHVTRGDSYYSYGANKPNPSFGPHAYDADNPRDQQLQGHN
jgi:hypothetical protein